MHTAPTLAAIVLIPALVSVRTAPLPAQAGDPNLVYHPSLYEGLEYRMVGPHRGGRVTAVAGVPGEPFTFYMGATGGGVWKTQNAGETWANISDGYVSVGSIGAVAVALSDPNVLYVGTGSACIRGNVSAGNGVYASHDAGKTWRHVGLRDAGQVGEILIHPRNPDLVYVAALGHAFGPNPQRGVFRSRNGGADWEHVLSVSDSTGAVDLAMNPRNPREIYAALWRAERKPWTLISGAGEGGLYKTTDGGDTWRRLEGGLPTGLIGKHEVTVSPANPSRVWAIIEASDGQGGIYRTDDAGEHWSRVNSNPYLIERPWYYNHIDADPVDENTVYVNGELLWRSVDGGKTFDEIPTPHGDNHDLWINPRHPQIMVQGNDGGANVTLDGGATWSTQLNQPTAEFYSVTVDNQFPYRLYGPQQDNSTLSLPSQVTGTGITLQHWLSVGGGETGPIAVRPDNPHIVYAGNYAGRIDRFDLRTEQSRQIRDYPEVQHGVPPRDLRYRFQWNSPIVISPHDPGVLYHASQSVHRSRNEGQSWEIISPDLTRNETNKQELAGGPITHDGTGVEIYNTIFTLVESPHEAGELWVGTNDGLVHLTRDNGATWNDITPSGLPNPSTVNRIELSRHRPGNAYLAAYRYRVDDFAPYIFRTEDYGRTWRLLTDGRNGIPSDHPTRVVREDPEREGLLYAGTEFGLFVSFDDGAHWQSLQQNLPHTPVTDLVLHQNDLVVATQGRSFWILDDVTPLRQLAPSVARADVHFFEPRATYRTRARRAGPDATLVRDPVHGARIPASRAGENPPDGAILSYYLSRQPQEEATLEILDGAGRAIRRFSNREDGGFVTTPGMHRFVWDLSHRPADLAERSPMARYLADRGPPAVPGAYQVRLTVGSWSQTRTLRVLKDPRLEATSADFQAQFDLLVRIRDAIDEMHDGIRAIRSVREQITMLSAHLEGETPQTEVDEIVREAERLTAELDAIQAALVQTGTISPFALPPALTGKLAWVYTLVAAADARPTDQAEERVNDLTAELAEQMSRLRRVLEGDVAAFNTMLRNRGVAPVIVDDR